MSRIPRILVMNFQRNSRHHFCQFSSKDAQHQGKHLVNKIPILSLGPTAGKSLSQLPDETEWDITAMQKSLRKKAGQQRRAERHRLPLQFDWTLYRNMLLVGLLIINLHVAWINWFFLPFPSSFLKQGNKTRIVLNWFFIIISAQNHPSSVSFFNNYISPA